MKKLTVFALLLSFVLSLVGCSSKAASVGIIGGADGPTAIFITSSNNWLNIYSLIAVIALAVLVAWIIYRNKK